MTCRVRRPHRQDLSEPNERCPARVLYHRAERPVTREWSIGNYCKAPERRVPICPQFLYARPPRSVRHREIIGASYVSIECRDLRRRLHATGGEMFKASFARAQP